MKAPILAVVIAATLSLSTAAAWAEGSHMDPNGGAASAALACRGGMIDPNGRCADQGNGMNPNGAAPASVTKGGSWFDALFTDMMELFR